MKHIDILTKELKKRGIDVGIEEFEVVKNSVSCTGIRIIAPDNPQVCPIVYYSSDETVETVADRIMGVMQAQSPKWDLSILQDSDYVRSHLFLAFTRRNGEAEQVLRREYLNLDMIMKLVIDRDDDSGEFVTKASPDLIRMAGLDEEDAWKCAMHNSEGSAKIRSIAECLGLPEELGPPMYVASCNGGNDGASVLCFPDFFKGFCKEHGMDTLTILPSSTQEVIVLPAETVPEREDLTAMVDEVNRNIVDPLLQLEPEVYCYTLADNAIRIVGA